MLIMELCNKAKFQIPLPTLIISHIFTLSNASNMRTKIKIQEMMAQKQIL